MLSEKPFKYQTIQITNENEEGTAWFISEYMTHFFEMDNMGTFTFRS